MRRWYVVLVSTVIMIALLPGCGPTDTVSSTESPAVSVSVTTTI